jgi:hypothetical protein
MAGLKVILLLVLGALLIPDYKRDKGLHTKAKIFHAACLALLTYSYGASFLALGVL